MIPYIITFLTSLFFLYLASVFEKRKNRILCIICQAIAVIVPCLLAAMRDYSIGTDTKGYVLERYNYTDEHNDLLSYLGDSHIGEDYAYYSMVFVSAKIFKSFFWNLFFAQLFTVVPLLVAFKKIGGNSHKWWAALVGMTLYYLYSYHLSLNMVRQSIALSFIVLSFVYYKQERYKAVFITTAISIFFHKSSLIMIPVYLVMLALRGIKEKRLKSLYLAIFVSAILVSIYFSQIVELITQIFPNLISNIYLNVFADEAQFYWSGLIFWYTLIILIMVFLRNIKVINICNNREMYLLLIFIACIPIVSSKIQYSERFLYFAQYLVVYYYIVFYGSNLSNEKNRRIITGVAIVLFAVYWAYYYVYIGIGDTVPYLLRN